MEMEVVLGVYIRNSARTSTTVTHDLKIWYASSIKVGQKGNFFDIPTPFLAMTILVGRSSNQICHRKKIKFCEGERIPNDF